MPLNRNPTIIDVAKAAGVSKSVVSRVLTGNGQVSPDARSKVEKTVAALGYSSNAAAQALALGRTKNIGLLLRRSTSPFYGKLMFDLQAHAAQAGYRMLAVTGNLDNDSESHALQTLLELRVDGLIIGSGNLPTEQILPIAASLPTVVVSRPAPGSAADVVQVDAAGQATEASRLLARHGHRRVGLITVPNSLSAASRLAALRERLGADGFELIEATGSYDFPQASVAAAELLSVPDRPTAVLSLSADGGWATLREAERSGLTVPGELSVLCFDEPDHGFAASRELTSITQGGQQLPDSAWRLLADRLEQPGLPPREVLVLGPTVAGSTFGPAAG